MGKNSVMYSRLCTAKFNNTITDFINLANAHDLIVRICRSFPFRCKIYGRRAMLFIWLYESNRDYDVIFSTFLYFPIQELIALKGSLTMSK